MPLPAKLFSTRWKNETSACFGRLKNIEKDNHCLVSGLTFQTVAVFFRREVLSLEKFKGD